MGFKRETLPDRKLHEISLKRYFADVKRELREAKRARRDCI